MKASLTFELPEEREEHECALRGAEYLGRLDAVDNYCRSLIKHEELDDKTVEILERVRGECGEIWG